MTDGDNNKPETGMRILAKQAETENRGCCVMWIMAVGSIRVAQTSAYDIKEGIACKSIEQFMHIQLTTWCPVCGHNLRVKKKVETSEKEPDK